MPEPLPPLLFAPIVKPLPWGGRRLELRLGKRLPVGTPCGESWEVVDLPGDQSLVLDGPLCGTTLAKLAAHRGEELLGDVPLSRGRFPLLFKFLDAHESLSVQVHPDEQAAREIRGASPKTEAWYILDADPGAVLWIGLRQGVSLEHLTAAIREGAGVLELLEPVPARPGEFHFLPAGTLHAIGAGVLLAEIQQSSDTTYRVYDHGRLGLDGRPRSLHIDEALLSIRPDLSGSGIRALQPLSGRPGVRCQAFSFERIGLSPGDVCFLEGGRPQIVATVLGAGALREGSRPPVPLPLGQTCLVPACRTVKLEATAAGSVFLLIRTGGPLKAE